MASDTVLGQLTDKYNKMIAHIKKEFPVTEESAAHIPPITHIPVITVNALIPNRHYINKRKFPPQLDDVFGNILAQGTPAAREKLFLYLEFFCDLFPQ
jgi:hypothetical protein